MTDAVPAPKAKKATKPKAPASHPKYIEMIGKAISTLKERGGSSRQAILKYIQANYKVGTGVAVNSRLKLALKSGVTKGSLKQSKGTGASGSFKLGEQQKKVAKKAAKPKKAAPAKKKAPAKKPAKKAVKPKAKKATTPKKKAAAKKPAKKAGDKKAKKATPKKKPAAKKPAAKKPAAKKAAAKK